MWGQFGIGANRYLLKSAWESIRTAAYHQQYFPAGQRGASRWILSAGCSCRSRWAPQGPVSFLGEGEGDAVKDLPAVIACPDVFQFNHTAGLCQEQPMGEEGANAQKRAQCSMGAHRAKRRRAARSQDEKAVSAQAQGVAEGKAVLPNHVFGKYGERSLPQPISPANLAAPAKASPLSQEKGSAGDGRELGILSLLRHSSGERPGRWQA